MANVPHYVDCAFSNQAEAFIFTSDKCVKINYVQDSIIDGPKKIDDFFRTLRNTIFAAGIKAAFATSAENEVYLFKNNKCILLNFANGNIIQGPKEIIHGFPFLKDSIFEHGIDAAFAFSQQNQAYIFKGDKYAVINYAASTSKDFWVTPAQQVSVGFPSFGPTVFKEGLGAAFSTNATNEAYIFKDNTYAHINYGPGPTNGFIKEPSTPIEDGFHSLRGIIPSFGPSD